MAGNAGNMGAAASPSQRDQSKSLESSLSQGTEEPEPRIRPVNIEDQETEGDGHTDGNDKSLIIKRVELVQQLQKKTGARASGQTAGPGALSASATSLRRAGVPAANADLPYLVLIDEAPDAGLQDQITITRGVQQANTQSRTTQADGALTGGLQKYNAATELMKGQEQALRLKKQREAMAATKSRRVLVSHAHLAHMANANNRSKLRELNLPGKQNPKLGSPQAASAMEIEGWGFRSVE